jgi:large subunit ribosomal protein L21
MYAVIKTGGKQYKVEKDDLILVERIDGEEGSSVSFDEVLMVNGKIGLPLVDDAKVTGLIVRQTRGEKVIVFKKKRRHGYRRKNGHKQDLTLVKIQEIVAA